MWHTQTIYDVYHLDQTTLQLLDHVEVENVFESEGEVYNLDKIKIKANGDVEFVFKGRTTHATYKEHAKIGPNYAYDYIRYQNL